MKKRIRAKDSLRTRYRPTCSDITFERFDGLGSLGVSRDGDNIVKVPRNPSIKRSYGAVDRNPVYNIKRSRRIGCGSGLFSPSLSRSSGATCEIRASGSAYCPDIEWGGVFQGIFYHPFENGNQQTTNLRTGPYVEDVLDDWYHVVFVRDGSFNALYVNGEVVSVSTNLLDNALSGGSNGLYIGGVKASSWVPDNIFNGRLDQVSVFDKKLGTSEVLSIYADGNGVPYSSWGAGLKNSAKSVIEFEEEVTKSNGGVIKNIVDDLPVAVSVGDTSQEYSLVTQPGKISTFSFTPTYVDALAQPKDNINAARSAVSSENSSQRAVLAFNDIGGTTPLKSVIESSAWTLSAWASPHGMAVSQNTQNQLNSSNIKITVGGVDYQQTAGVIFSDYNGYSSTVDANFSISYNGLFQNF